MSSPTENTTATGPDGQPAEGIATATAQPADASVSPPPRPVAAVALLAAHPGNVRRDLRLTPEFLASVTAVGILVPLRVTPTDDGGYRVIDGHRRLAAAIKTGRAEVPISQACPPRDRQQP